LKDRSSGAAVNLIQMPNGTGKTTIIELIIGTLTGNAKNWTSTEVSDFQGSNTIDEGEFKLTLRVEDSGQNKNEITLVLNFDFIHNLVSTLTFDDKVGVQSGWIIPREIAPFLEEKCVDVFVFKGDKTDDVVTRGKGDAQPAIKTFFGITALEDLQEKIKDAFSAKMLGVNTDRSHERATNKKKKLLDNWVIRQNNLQSKKDKFKKEKKDLDSQFKTANEKYENIIQQVDLVERRVELKEKMDSAEVKLNDLSRTVVQNLRDPFSFSPSIYNDIDKLKQTLNDLELPGTSRSFFEQWVKRSDTCICGEELTNDKKKRVLINVESYLASDDINIIEGIKGEVGLDVLNGASREKLDDSVSALDAANEEYEISKTKFKNHIRELEAGAHPDSQKIIDDYRKIITKQATNGLLIKSIEKDVPFTDNDLNFPSKCNSLTMADKIVESLATELGNLANMENIVKAKSKLLKVIDCTAEESLLKFRSHLISETNIKLRKYLREGSEIEVLNIDKNVQLGWNEKEKEKGSGAQNSISIYSFATSILERADINFPLIVDHPVTNMDSSSRKHIGEKLADISHQFIGFVIDIEKPHFLPALERNGNVRYVSLFSKIAGNRDYIDQLKDQSSDLKYETSNGCISYDKDFFHNNQMGTDV
jgi:DNA sulfur modification protein DndD